MKYIIYHWKQFGEHFSMQICSAFHEILANKAFIVTNDLISQLFIITFIHPTYIQIVFIWGFLAQLSL